MGQMQICSYFLPLPPEINVVNLQQNVVNLQQNVVNLRTGREGQVISPTTLIIGGRGFNYRSACYLSQTIMHTIVSIF